MSKKVCSWTEYGKWLLEQTSGFDDLVEKVAAVTAAIHPSDHEFVESETFPGTCAECGWIDPATETDCNCPKTLAEHVSAMPAFIREQFEMAAVAEALSSLGAVVIEIDTSPRRPTRSGRRTDD